jgi:hypothetical protein
MNITNENINPHLLEALVSLEQAQQVFNTVIGDQIDSAVFQVRSAEFGLRAVISRAKHNPQLVGAPVLDEVKFASGASILDALRHTRHVM